MDTFFSMAIAEMNTIQAVGLIVLAVLIAKTAWLTCDVLVKLISKIKIRNIRYFSIENIYARKCAKLFCKRCSNSLDKCTCKSNKDLSSFKKYKKYKKALKLRKKTLKEK